MEIVLVPGLWLNASTWDRVTPALAAAGHHPTPLTLPGMAGRDTDRAGIVLEDHVAAVVAAIDAAAGPVLLVGHSAGCGIAHAAVDARPDRVAHVVHVGGFPSADGELLLTGLEAHHGEVAMPDWVEMGEAANVADLDEQQLADFYAAAVPVPEGVLTTPVRLRDERRFDVPVTMVCPEYRAADLQGWLAEDPDALSELARLTSVTYVDLPAGHWPQLTRPDDLARVILDAVPTPSETTSAPPGAEAPPWEPPLVGTEAEHLAAALDRQRATFRWKAGGLDGAGLSHAIPSSTLTLGGLLKHLALVEDHYFVGKLRGQPLGPPWAGVDFDADPTWEFTSAVDDAPEELYALWDAAADRSRAAYAAALADGGLDGLVDLGWKDGRRPSLRRLLCDLIEEYGRHTGHADLLREAVDGLVGEDPPADWRP